MVVRKFGPQNRGVVYLSVARPPVNLRKAAMHPLLKTDPLGSQARCHQRPGTPSAPQKKLRGPLFLGTAHTFQN
jgi:hypothetical protein